MENQSASCFFIEASTIGGATLTKTATPALKFSVDKINWYKFPSKLRPVTGKIDSGSYGLVIKNLVRARASGFLDLGDYELF